MARSGGGVEGSEIKKIRLRLHVSQAQLARLLGWDQGQQVCYLENGSRKPTVLVVAVLRLIKRALDRRPSHEVYRRGDYTLQQRLEHVAEAAAGHYEAGSPEPANCGAARRRVPPVKGTTP